MLIDLNKKKKFSFEESDFSFCVLLLLFCLIKYLRWYTVLGFKKLFSFNNRLEFYFHLISVIFFSMEILPSKECVVC